MPVARLNFTEEPTKQSSGAAQGESEAPLQPPTYPSTRKQVPQQMGGGAEGMVSPGMLHKLQDAVRYRVEEEVQPVLQAVKAVNVELLRFKTAMEVRR